MSSLAQNASCPQSTKNGACGQEMTVSFHKIERKYFRKPTIKTVIVTERNSTFLCKLNDYKRISPKIRANDGHGWDGAAYGVPWIQSDGYAHG